MSKNKPARFFIELDNGEGGSGTFERGFYFAREFPKHKVMHIAEGDEYDLLLLHTGDEPTSADILKMLEEDDDYAEYLDTYRDEVSDDINNAMTNILEEA